MKDKRPFFSSVDFKWRIEQLNDHDRQLAQRSLLLIQFHLLLSLVIIALHPILKQELGTALLSSLAAILVETFFSTRRAKRLNDAEALSRLDSHAAHCRGAIVFTFIVMLLVHLPSQNNLGWSALPIILRNGLPIANALSYGNPVTVLTYLMNKNPPRERKRLREYFSNLLPTQKPMIST